jgi:multidrug efflux pump subunit AcrA (membrane-fusion protein)
VAQENRRMAELEVKRAQEVLAQREIRSPVAGVVVEVMPEARRIDQLQSEVIATDSHDATDR